MPTFDFGKVTSGLTQQFDLKGTVQNAAGAELRKVAAPVTDKVQDLRNGAESVQQGLSQATGRLGPVAQSVADTAVDRRMNSDNNVSSEYVPVPGAAVMNNELEQFANGTFIFTLGVLSTRGISFPDQTYRRNGNSSGMILRSGGGLGETKALTAYETSGKLEYYIDDVEIESLIAPTSAQRSTNATTISFKIMEPYSMGLFLQTLQVASAAEFRNYLETPMLLTVEFVGQDDDGKFLPPVAKRFIPLKLVKMDMNVSGGGTIYDVQAVAYNEASLSDNVQTMETDIKLDGATLQEILDTGPGSLASVLNDRFRRQAELDQSTRPDEVVIVFPNDPSSTKGSTGSSDGVSSTIFDVTGNGSLNDFARLSDLPPQARTDAAQEQINSFNSSQSSVVAKIRESLNGQANDIGKSKMIPPSIDSDGIHPFADAQAPRQTEGDVWVNDVMGVSADRRSYMFAKDSKVQDIIEELILVSDYGKQFADPKPDRGMVDWYKIETEVYPITDDSAQIRSGKVPKVYVYKVQPYKVHMASISGPNSTPPDIDYLKANAAKQYDYIYTGLNNDILDFEIELNNQFFGAVSADGDANSAGMVTNGANSTSPSGDPQFTPGSNGSATGAQGTVQTTGNHSTGGARNGGGGVENTETRVARTFNDALINSQADLLALNFTIMGDPYYLADSGIGNYNSRPGTLNVTQDGQMDYQRSEVDIIVNFRTPIDYDESTGLMEFPEDTMAVEAFSGVYKVIKVTNMWRGGKFTQDIECIRRRNQENKNTGDSALKSQNANAASGLDEVGRQTGSPAAVDAQSAGNSTVGFEQDLAGGLAAQDQALNALEQQVSGIVGQGTELANQVSGVANRLSDAKDQAINVADRLRTGRGF